jgi:hypothetical protein
MTDEKGRQPLIQPPTAGERSSSGAAPESAPALEQARPGDAQEAPPETGDFRFTYDNVIRELRILELDITYFRNVVSLGSARAIRIKCLDKACSVIERVRDEERKRRARK